MITTSEETVPANPVELFNIKLKELMPRGRLGRLEEALSYVMPKFALRREQTRRSIALLRAQGAYSNLQRPNAKPGQTGNTPQRQREARQLMWNALELIDNSGLGESITGKYADYVFGNLRFQARTSDKHVNEQYEAYMKVRCGACIDLSKRHSLRTKMRLSVRGGVVKGGVGLRQIREEPDSEFLSIAGYEYDRIGGLYAQRLEEGYVDGIGFDLRTGQELYFDTYRRDRFGGFYKFDERVPAYDEEGRRIFIHLMSPKDFDQYKGETAFKTVIDHVFYIDEIRKYELQALMQASVETLMYKTKDGFLPRQQGAYNRQVDPLTGRMTNIYTVGGGRVSSMSIDEDVKMFEHGRVSPNVIAAWDNTEQEICNALQMHPMFATGKSPGNSVDSRMAAAMTGRSIQNYWINHEEKALIPIGEGQLGNGIAKGHIPYHPEWRQFRFLGPSDIKIDAGYDSAAALNEIAEGLETESNYVGLKGEDIDEIRKTRSLEVLDTRIAADEMCAKYFELTGKRLDPDWCYAQLKRGQNASSGNLAAVIADDKDLASDGVALEDEDKTKPPIQSARQRETIEIRIGGSPQRQSAYMSDVRLGDLDEDTRSEVRRFRSDAPDSALLPKYGKVVNELLGHIDPANMEAARRVAAKKTRQACRDEVEAKRGTKHILTLNERITDGHHFLAHAERGKVTNSLNVLDLTPLKYQSPNPPV